MSQDPSLPKFEIPLNDKGGNTSKNWYFFFQGLLNSLFSLTVTDGTTTVQDVETITVAGGAVTTTGAGEATITVTGGGSSGVEFTDGTNTVNGATKLTVTGGTIGGTTPNATLNIASGGSLSVTDGTHTVTPVTSIDFSGAVVSGTTPNATVTISGSGTVTSVGLADTSTAPIYNVTGSPVTTSGTVDLTLKTQTANTVFAGPASGSAAQPGFRAIQPQDLPLFAGIGNYNITPDTHASLPTSVGVGPNDEFETGSTIDTAGTRYTGATAWSAFNLGSGSTNVTSGAIVFVPQVGAGVNYSGYIQATPSSGPWTYTAKVALANSTNTNLGGLLLTTSAGTSGRLYLFGLSSGGSASPNGTVTCQRATNVTTFSANEGIGTVSGNISGATSSFVMSPWIYMQIAFDGTNLTFANSPTGVPGDFITIFTEPLANFLVNVAGIGIGAENQSSGNLKVISDWFRRTA